MAMIASTKDRWSSSSISTELIFDDCNVGIVWAAVNFREFRKLEEVVDVVNGGSAAHDLDNVFSLDGSTNWTISNVYY